jgi:hypothetical protein
MEGFLLKTTTCQGYALAIGGLCCKGTASLHQQQFEKINELQYGNLQDIYLVDYHLSREIASLALPSLHIIGATLTIENMTEATGGILGNPYSNITSASGEIEEIATGVFQFALPGGPGIVLWGNYLVSNQIFRYALDKYHTGPKNRFQSVKDLLHATGITKYIMVSDGSGPQHFGCIAIGDGIKNYYVEI